MILLLFLQALIGFAIGFYFTDKRRGISRYEIQLSAIVVMVTIGTFIIFKNDNLITVNILMITALSACAMFTTIFLGEYIHIRIIEHIMKDMQKESIHSAIAHFVHVAKQTANHEGNGKEILDIELYKTVSRLHYLSERATCFKQKALAQQINAIAESCATLSRLSVCSYYDPESRQNYQRLADQLLAISWETLSHAEKHIQDNLAKSWNTIAFAMKAVHMK